MIILDKYIVNFSHAWHSFQTKKMKIMLKKRRAIKWGIDFKYQMQCQIYKFFSYSPLSNENKSKRNTIILKLINTWLIFIFVEKFFNASADFIGNRFDCKSWDGNREKSQQSIIIIVIMVGRQFVSRSCLRLWFRSRSWNRVVGIIWTKIKTNKSMHQKHTSFWFYL